mmetsp:Transcript_65691/g.182852  ORF Transcript_65691/g.182852 Transcript_65691/m.182852 type:complete len:619 (+) Transcript_65691:106-1962(+)
MLADHLEPILDHAFASGINDFQVLFDAEMTEAKRRLWESLEDRVTKLRNSLLRDLLATMDADIAHKHATAHRPCCISSPPESSETTRVRPRLTSPAQRPLPDAWLLPMGADKCPDGADGCAAQVVPRTTSCSDSQELIQKDVAAAGILPSESPPHPASQEGASLESASSEAAGDRSSTKATRASQSSVLWQRILSPTGSSSSLASSATSVQRLVTSQTFDSIMGFAIVLNCVSMGFDAHVEATDSATDLHRQFVGVLEQAFTIVFTFEVLMKYVAFGWRAFMPYEEAEAWNLMDLVLVIFTGMLFSWVLPLVSLVTGVSNENETVRTLLVLRAVRLLRLVRLFQKVPAFREAWLLIRGLGHSVRTLIWTFVVIGFMTYVFAIVGLMVFVPSIRHAFGEVADSERHEAAKRLWPYVGGLDLFMYTLIQVLLGDSFHSITRDFLVFVQWSWLYFYAYIGIGCVVMMNLVTAIIVDNALDSSRKDEALALRQKEIRKERDLAELHGLFTMMDADGSGTLSWQEFKASFKDPDMCMKWAMLDYRPEECKELFELLDDGDGEIETQEFFEGLARMKGAAQSKDIFRLQKTLDQYGGFAIGSPKTRGQNTPRSPKPHKVQFEDF